ncbi:carbonate dehydratase [Biscogniauxia mediterranea]|nr:carbonate dehydratase [Biscogniauxia mediterranea]
MATDIQKHFKEKNAEYASTFTQGHLALPPAKKYLIVTCMDARIDPAAAFGIAPGDAHVVRNAGGSARDALRSVLVSQLLLGTREVLVVKHTGCGMLTFGNADARRLLAQHRGDAVAGLDFLPFADLDAAVRDDVDFLRSRDAAAADPQVPVTGWVYDVQTGRVRQVV